MHVQIVLFDGFDPLDVIAPFEVLHAGGAASRGAVSVELVSAEGPREVVGGTGGLALRATAALDPARADVVLVPGAAGPVGEPGEEPAAGADASIPVLLGRTLSTGLPALLGAAMDDPATTVATVCGGSLVLALAGLVEGRPVTTHHLGLDLLDATGGRAVRARVVDDGDLVSGAGVTSGLDLALHLLEREIGPRVAHAVEELFAYERRGTVWRDAGAVPVAF
ncbi:DJ-1/PfpI family protein [Streptomyces sp. Q6]|uniref:DJ-1/PfpI family protein n=1 Tax=Streptomyces citrinus TaxID=3118173 RepID=A0ACD5A5F6_9ACTN